LAILFHAIVRFCEEQFQCHRSLWISQSC
jgi:hypothetical protein